MQSESTRMNEALLAAGDATLFTESVGGSQVAARAPHYGRNGAGSVVAPLILRPIGAPLTHA